MVRFTSRLAEHAADSDPPVRRQPMHNLSTLSALVDEQALAAASDAAGGVEQLRLGQPGATRA